MGEIIEHDEGSNRPSICVGDGSSSVSIKIYQDIYHQVTKRTEQISKRFNENLKINFSEIEQLHHKVKQICDIHNIVASNEIVTIFHEKERKEQFTSFDRFRNYNSNATNHTVNVVLKYNVSIIPAGLNKPQEYVITIRLNSRVAMLEEIESHAPPFIRGSVISYLTEDTAVITIDYADYVIARGFLEAFEEWIRGCDKESNNHWLKLLKRWSHLIPEITKITVAFTILMYALQSVPNFFSTAQTYETGARFLIFFSGGFYLITNFAKNTGKIIENAIDGFSTISYLDLNKGDSNLIKKFIIRKRNVVIKFFSGCLLTIFLGFISSQIAELI